MERVWVADAAPRNVDCYIQCAIIKIDNRTNKAGEKLLSLVLCRIAHNDQPKARVTLYGFLGIIIVAVIFRRSFPRANIFND